MAAQSSSNAVDLQKLLSGAAKLELKLLNAGVEAMQVYINQASRFSTLAGETLQAIQDDKATLSDTARKLTAFGRQNAQAFTSLSQKLSVSYFDEIERMADRVLKASRKTEPAALAVKPAPEKKPRRRGRAARKG